MPVDEHPALAETALARVLRILVRTRSQNPIDGEAAMANAVAALLEPTGAELTFVEHAPGRPSVAALISGERPGPRLVLNGHIDTVPAGPPDAWSVDPFAGVIRDGRLYGRGACDMKAGLTAQLAVASVLADRRRDMAGSLVLHFAAGEETAEPGTASLLRAGFGGDVGVTTEPTQLRVAVAQRGAAYLHVRIGGRMAHAGRPELGANPVERIPAVLEALDRYRAEIGTRAHPVLSPGTCTPTVLRAGDKANVVPGICEIVLDRRLLPSESADAELARVRELLAPVSTAASPVTVELGPHHFEPSETRAGSPFAALVRDAVTDVTGETDPYWGTPYASDVRNLIRDAGMDAVTFGPGDIDLAHAIDEHVELAQVSAAARVLAAVASRVLLDPDQSPDR